MTARSCLLCGLEDATVRMGLVAWREPIAGRTFEAIPRCADRQACRGRVEALGDVWPLVDATKASAAPKPVHSPEPAVASDGWF